MAPSADGEPVWHYLDHAATTPLRPEALEAMLPVLKDGTGNPSGAHALARQARAALDGAREQLAGVVGCRPGELVFTGGGTEADNLAVRGVLGARSGTVVCSAIEHHAVLHPAQAAGGRTVPVDPRGLVDLDALAGTLDADVALVSVMLVNNEVGTIQPLDAIAEVVHDRAPGALLHADAAQAISWIDVAVAAAAADLVTLASHKCGGPVGTGASDGAARRTSPAPSGSRRRPWRRRAIGPRSTSGPAAGATSS
jgi:cysteine desulfurase